MKTFVSIVVQSVLNCKYICYVRAVNTPSVFFMEEEMDC